MPGQVKKRMEKSAQDACKFSVCSTDDVSVLCDLKVESSDERGRLNGLPSKLPVENEGNGD